MPKPRIPVSCASALMITEEIEARHRETPGQAMCALVVDDEVLRSLGVPSRLSSHPTALLLVRDELERIASEPSFLERLRTAALSAMMSNAYSLPMESTR